MRSGQDRLHTDATHQRRHQAQQRHDVILRVARVLRVPPRAVRVHRSPTVRVGSRGRQPRSNGAGKQRHASLRTEHGRLSAHRQDERADDERRGSHQGLDADIHLVRDVRRANQHLTAVGIPTRVSRRLLLQLPKVSRESRGGGGERRGGQSRQAGRQGGGWRRDRDDHSRSRSTATPSRAASNSLRRA